MVFSITIRAGHKNYHILCEQVYDGECLERFKVYPEKNPDKYLVLQSNRPLLRKKFFLKKKRIEWKLLEGNVFNPKAFDQLLREIEYRLEPPPKFVHPQK